MYLFDLDDLCTLSRRGASSGYGVFDRCTIGKELFECRALTGMLEARQARLEISGLRVCVQRITFHVPTVLSIKYRHALANIVQPSEEGDGET